MISANKASRIALGYKSEVLTAIDKAIRKAAKAGRISIMSTNLGYYELQVLDKAGYIVEYQGEEDDRYQISW